MVASTTAYNFSASPKLHKTSRDSSSRKKEGVPRLLSLLEMWTSLCCSNTNQSTTDLKNGPWQTVQEKEELWGVSMICTTGWGGWGDRKRWSWPSFELSSHAKCFSGILAYHMAKQPLNQQQYTSIDPAIFDLNVTSACEMPLDHHTIHVTDHPGAICTFVNGSFRHIRAFFWLNFECHGFYCRNRENIRHEKVLPEFSRSSVQWPNEINATFAFSDFRLSSAGQQGQKVAPVGVITYAALGLRYPPCSSYRRDGLPVQKWWTWTEANAVSIPAYLPHGLQQRSKINSSCIELILCFKICKFLRRSYFERYKLPWVRRRPDVSRHVENSGDYWGSFFLQKASLALMFTLTFLQLVSGPKYHKMVRFRILQAPLCAFRLGTPALWA